MFGIRVWFIINNGLTYNTNYMQFKILNCPDKDFRPYLERAAIFYAKELIPDTRLRNRCFTKIRFDANIMEYGYCSVEDYNTRKQPREFLIEIHPGLGAPTILSVLAHEMVHVKQLAKGVLKTRKTGSFIWAGKRYSKKTEYLSMPWEIEAFSKQELILRRAFQA